MPGRSTRICAALRHRPHLRLTFAAGPAKSLRNTCPSFITNFTRSSSVTSFVGLPETATRSAYLPLSIDPTRSPRQYCPRPPTLRTGSTNDRISRSRSVSVQLGRVPPSTPFVPTLRLAGKRAPRGPKPGGAGLCVLLGAFPADLGRPADRCGKHSPLYVVSGERDDRSLLLGPGPTRPRATL